MVPGLAVGAVAAGEGAGVDAAVVLAALAGRAVVVGDAVAAEALLEAVADEAGLAGAERPAVVVLAAGVGGADVGDGAGVGHAAGPVFGRREGTVRVFLLCVGLTECRYIVYLI